MDSSNATPTHPGVRTYALVFLVLAVITLIELWLSGQAAMAYGLRSSLFVVLSLGKAALVAGFYMHLRGDSRFYTVVFIIPVVLFLAFALLMIIR